MNTTRISEGGLFPSQNLFEQDNYVQNGSSSALLVPEEDQSSNIDEPEFTEGFDNESNIDPKSILKEFNKMSKELDENRENVGLLVVKPANKWMKEAKDMPTPKKLFGDLWYEGEICILFADTNLGKSILGVQIGDGISKGKDIQGFSMEAKAQLVLYVDCESSKKQFGLRYSCGRSDGYDWSDNFLRTEFNQDDDIPCEYDFEAFILASIEQCVIDWGVKILIVDNITYLRNATETAKDALPLMKKLKTLKNKYGLSILVLAHTPKRDLSKPITRNDLQGSKMLINFCDSCFAIGECSSDKNLRYIKQIKQRNCENLYGADNVCVFKIVKPGNFLHFEFVGYSTEKEHLRVPSDSANPELVAEVKKLKEEGSSVRKIADELNISKSTVQRLCKKE
ncbi:MAG: AAA family ATPase [Bacteroidales bacterium]|nr:AAA family ATPase [Bacteroidales bacterium]